MTTTAGNFQHPPTPPAIPTGAILTGGSAKPLYQESRGNVVTLPAQVGLTTLVAKEFTALGQWCRYCRTIHDHPATPLEGVA